MHTLNTGYATQPPKPQQGAALIMALAILLIMTVIGVTSMSNTSLEQRMAGNTQEKRLSFQAAENALREAEGVTFKNSPKRGIGVYDVRVTDGQLRVTDPSEVDWDGATGHNGGGILNYTTGSLTGVKTAPKYLILYNDTAPINAGVDRSNLRGQIQLDRYVISTRGTGGADTTRTYLQSSVGARHIPR